MIVNISSKILMFINPLTSVLHSIATFGMVLDNESFDYLRVCPHVNLSSRYRSLVTSIFPLLNQLQRLMFSRYPVAYAVNLTTRREELHL